MGLFSDSKKKYLGKKGTTKDFFLGKPDADAEGNSNGHLSFDNFFEDFVDITSNINSGRFIILGRKGAGKSAYVKWVMDRQENDLETYADKIKGEDLKLQQLLQNLPAEVDERHSLLFEWVIQMKLIELIAKSTRASSSDGVTALKKFFQDNSGLMTLDGLSTTSMKKTRDLTIDLSSISRLLPLKWSRTTEKNLERPLFYAFIPTLREILKTTFAYQDLSDIDFALMFDELDYKFNLRDSTAKTQLMDLVRITRNYNVDYLKNTNVKILIFMRDDIGRALDGIANDKSKIFESHSYTINWYDPIDAGTDEKEVKLRKFINKRLKANFDYLGFPCNHKDPWLSFVKNNDKKIYRQKTAFKHILDHTFYRPRDIINIFGKVGEHTLRLPLSPNDIMKLLREYARRNYSEITDELSVIYDSQQMKAFTSAISSLCKHHSPIPYTKVIQALNASHLGKAELETLVAYSIIAPYDAKNKLNYFNFREAHPVEDLKDYSFTIPYGIQLYFNPRATTSMDFSAMDNSELD